MKTMKPTITLSALILFVSLFLIGCDELAMEGTFPHKPHMEQELTCDTCHELQDQQVSMPKFEVCLTCHEAEDDVFAKCNECHAKKKITVKEDSVDTHWALIEPLLPDDWKDVKFHHALHLENEVEVCLGCHQEIHTSDHSALKNIPSMEEAMAYNETHGISNECSVCHLRINPITPPASHDSAWDRKHGMLEPFTEKERCLLCHQESTCDACHRTETPKSHTNLWRRKTHGIQSAFDRSSCLVCHRNDECMICHRTAAPAARPTSFHNPSAACMACHAPYGAPRPANPYLKRMPHRMMMGESSGKCLECHAM